MTENEFQKQLDWLVEETGAAMAVYDVYEEIHRLLLDRPDLESAMLADHVFWQVHLGALQNALFATLGRIFDKGRDAHSITKVLDAAEQHIGFFSLERLAARKTNGGPRPPWLDEYLRTAWVGDRQTIVRLRQSLEPHIRHYRKICEPLRHTYFAHRSLAPKQSVAEMFGQTNREEVGKMVQHLRDVAGVLQRALMNGRPPILGNTNYESDRERSRFAVRSVLEKLSQWPFSCS